MKRPTYMRQDPFTGHWLNTQPCWSCQKALAKKGKHRAHECDGQTISGYAALVCDCECQRMSTSFLKYLENMPAMSLG